PFEIGHGLPRLIGSARTLRQIAPPDELDRLGIGPMLPWLLPEQAGCGCARSSIRRADHCARGDVRTDSRCGNALASHIRSRAGDEAIAYLGDRLDAEAAAANAT